MAGRLPDSEPKFLHDDLDARAIVDNCTENPTVVHNPFIAHMITSNASAQSARNMIQPTVPLDTPVWSFARNGRTLTQVPGLDGDATPRTLYIGGSHQTFFSRDFFIYNDVVVFKTLPSGHVVTVVYGYPIDVFLQTDFHTATYYRKPGDGSTPAKDYIYIIGGFGYDNSAHRRETVMQRLDLQSYRVERVATSGDDDEVPPPHSRAEARLMVDTIVVTWGNNGDHQYGLYLPLHWWVRWPRDST